MGMSQSYMQEFRHCSVMPVPSPYIIYWQGARTGFFHGRITSSPVGLDSSLARVKAKRKGGMTLRSRVGGVAKERKRINLAPLGNSYR